MVDLLVAKMAVCSAAKMVELMAEKWVEKTVEN